MAAKAEIDWFCELKKTAPNEIKSRTLGDIWLKLLSLLE
jgi:hypothetical protein